MMSSESSVTSPTDEKKNYEEKRYAIITKETVKMMAEAAGHPDLPDSAASLLGEDVSYRLREVAMSCTQYMRHSKRKRMTTEDFNKALRQSDIQPVFGHGSGDSASFRQTRDGELHFTEDMEVNLPNVSSNSHIPIRNGETTIKAHWLAVEGVQKSSSSTQNTAGKAGVKKEMTDELHKYYDNLTKAILGCDTKTMKFALRDLQTNPNIVPLLPYLVNFVSNGVKTVSHDLSQLSKLLHTVRSLVHNQNLYLEPQPYLSVLMQAVMYCVLEPLAASINPRNDHWVLRDAAARLLAQIVSRWSSPLNHLRYSTEKTLKETLYDSTKPLCSHYGAVMGLLSLGCKQVEEIVVPHLSTYMPRLSTIIDDTSVSNVISRGDAHRVHGALLLAAELVLKRRNQDFDKEYFSQEECQESVDNTKCASQKHPRELYCELYEYFGDSLSMRMPEPQGRHMFKPEKPDKIVRLFEGSESKSGEELLEDFMEQVRIQQIEQEKREREEKERREREKIEEERRERERIERLRRAEEERRQRVIIERQRIEEERRRMWEEQRRQAEIRRKYEEQQRRELEKHRLLEEQLPRRRIPRHSPITYPNEDEEDDDDFLEEVGAVSTAAAAVEADCENSGGEGGTGKHNWGEEEESDESVEEEPPTLAVSTISDPNKGGIKLKIKRQPKLKLQISRDKVSIKEESVHVDKPVEKHKDRESSKHKRKRKQLQKSPKDHDPFDFDKHDKADPDYMPKMSFTPSHIYSSPGGESSGSDSQFRHKSKLTLKLKVPSKDTMSE